MQIQLLSRIVWKKKFLVNCNFIDLLLFIYLFIWHLIFFFIFLCVHTSKGTLMEIRIEYFTLAVLLFYLIILLCSLFICILNIFDSEINIYIHINCELIHITTNLCKTSYWPLTTLWKSYNTLAKECVLQQNFRLLTDFFIREKSRSPLTCYMNSSRL